MHQDSVEIVSHVFAGKVLSEGSVGAVNYEFHPGKFGGRRERVDHYDSVHLNFPSARSWEMRAFLK